MSKKEGEGGGWWGWLIWLFSRGIYFVPYVLAAIVATNKQCISIAENSSPHILKPFPSVYLSAQAIPIGVGRGIKSTKLCPLVLMSFVLKTEEGNKAEWYEVYKNPSV